MFPGVGASCVPSEFHLILGSVCVHTCLLLLAMCYSFLLVWLWSMFPWVGSLLLKVGIWLFVLWMVDCMHLIFLHSHCSCLGLILSITFLRLLCSMGGLLVVMVSVPSLWIVMPWLPGRNTVVYPFSNSLFFHSWLTLLVLGVCWPLLLSE